MSTLELMTTSDSIVIGKRKRDSHCIDTAVNAHNICVTCALHGCHDCICQVFLSNLRYCSTQWIPCPTGFTRSYTQVGPCADIANECKIVRKRTITTRCLDLSCLDLIIPCLLLLVYEKLAYRNPGTSWPGLKIYRRLIGFLCDSKQVFI